MRMYELSPNTKKIFVVGDLHGDFNSYEKILNEWKKEKDSTIVFLGDYADRGEQGVEVIESLEKLSKQKEVVALKGNHEDYYEFGDPRFFPCNLITEVKAKRGNWDSYFKQFLQPFFQSLYLSAMLLGKILFVHGGISSKIKNIDSLKHPDGEIEEDILWSDPSHIQKETPNRRGAGVEFGEDITKNVLRNINAEIVIRSHQPNLAKTGPDVSHNGKVLTISSTSVYGGRPHYLEINVDEVSEFLKNPKKFSYYCD